jgi:hypothetical protein
VLGWIGQEVPDPAMQRKITPARCAPKESLSHFALISSLGDNNQGSLVPAGRAAKSVYGEVGLHEQVL